ncbi:hypothetical protein MPRM_28800 [Mycobacterium parmense]|uniref:Uncharacterized protein n=1 Tax=Mycobacterium parmense TaxID=185642 RepID=A0A7I7YV96_9MYCO|nr:hypothetical protein MPRM_28800 [Mycobacterium parmense]
MDGIGNGTVGPVETTDPKRERRLTRVAIIAGITLVVLMVLAVSIYVGVVVILAPMAG